MGVIGENMRTCGVNKNLVKNGDKEENLYKEYNINLSFGNMLNILLLVIIHFPNIIIYVKL